MRRRACATADGVHFSVDKEAMSSTDDAAAPLYSHIPWTRCVIGGSYALQQFTRASWTPHDIDIMCALDTPDELLNMSRALCRAVNGTNSDVPCLERMTLVKRAADMDEMFHESIVGTTMPTTMASAPPKALFTINGTGHLGMMNDFVPPPGQSPELLPYSLDPQTGIERHVYITNVFLRAALKNNAKSYERIFVSKDIKGPRGVSVLRADA